MASEPRPKTTQRNEFVTIAASLQEKIRSGEIGLGRILPTERELQEEFSVSRSTIRRALQRLTEEGWVQIVPNRGAVASAGFSRPKTTKVALIDGGTYVLRVLLHRFSQKLQKYGYQMVHLAGAPNIAIEDPLQYAQDHDFAGAIIWPYRGFSDESVMERLTTSIPVVALNHLLPGGKVDLVTFDYIKAAEEATRHLLASGCKRIAITGMMDMMEANHHRFTGYLRALFDAGLQPQPRDFLFNFTSALSEPDNWLLEQRLRSPDRPDGLFVFQDEFIASTVETVLRCGLRIPEDIKLVTIGDEVDVTVNDCGMTSIALDWDTMAQQAADLLLDRIENPTRELKVITAPHQLIKRGMGGEPKADWTTDPDQLTGFHGDFPYPKFQYQYTSNWTVTSTAPRPINHLR